MIIVKTHLIFECDNVKEIWSKLCTTLHLDIMWKHVIIGFYYENNLKVQFLNNIISYVAYRIYKFKMLCRFEEKNETSQSLNEYVKNYLIRDMNYITMYLKSSK